MTDVIVRRAQPADLDLLVPMFESYRAFYRCKPDGVAARDFLSMRLDRGDSAMYVAVDEKTHTGAGFVHLYPVFSSLHMRRAWILNDLFVEPSYRRLGVGRQLMEAARALAVETQSVTLTLETARDNDTARKLYESLGYQQEETFLQYVLEV